MPSSLILSRPEPPAPRTGDEPPFAAPWEAQAFALVVALHERGLFTWTEWSAALGAEVHRPEAATDGRDYYAHWIRALEGLLASRDLADPAQIESLTASWHRAARATPHGTPILLKNDPERMRDA
jgi:nitrile hydratase accessory protein